jgi:hypothetical protein
VFSPSARLSSRAHQPERGRAIFDFELGRQWLCNEKYASAEFLYQTRKCLNFRQSPEPAVKIFERFNS